ncbi:hypothetical protein KKF05_00300 [Patescibacteria group bacterium]|nr:hypothetical protein [Patescibacteria group bacterium]
MAVILLITLALSILHSAGLSVFPWPLNLICLPLIIISSLALGLHFSTAVAAAVVYGVITDALSPTIFGLYTSAAVLTVIIVAILLHRILTHHTIGAVAGVNAAIFLLIHLLVYLFSSILKMLSGADFFHPATGYAFLLVLATVPVQVALALLLRFASGGVRSYMSRFILLK